MRPRAIDGLHLADDPFFKIKPPLPPPENFRHRRFAFERSEDRVTHRSVLQINSLLPRPDLKVKRPLRWLRQLICRISAAEN